jgi:replicative DNA helicase
VDPPPVAGRVPPHDLDAEAAVLSAILLDGDALDRVLEILKAEHFYSHANGRIFQAAQQLAIEQSPIDIVSVASWLRDREWLPKMGGTAYLAQLADATPAVGHVEAHARVVFEKWRLRELIATCQRGAAEGYGDVGHVQTFLDAFEGHIFALTHDRRASGHTIAPIAEGMREGFDKINEAAARGDRLTGIPTGYDRLDAEIAGLHDGDLTIVAARPGMGKTSFVMCIAVNVAKPRPLGNGGTQPGFGVCVFSMEMPRDQIAMRAACAEGRVDLGRLRRGHLLANDWRALTESASFISRLPIWVDDTPGLSVLELRAKVRRIQAHFNREAADDKPAQRVGLVVVDYLQLMRGRDGVQSREQEISEISRGLKGLAKELKLPVIALSQLNRAVESRGKDKRPQLSDLRESGAIEQDADTIVFIYRDDYYNPETTDAKGIAELLIAKQRSGPTGRVKVRFTASCTRFDNLAPGEHPDTED